MNWNRRVLPAAALLSLASVQAGCVDLVVTGAFRGAAAVAQMAQPRRARELPNPIQLSSSDEPCNPPDLARLARCSEIEVAVANSSGAILYGDSPCPGQILGFVLPEDEIDQAALGRVRDRVGQVFAGHLRRAFPEKNVSYHTKGPDFSAPRFDSARPDPDSSAVCLLSFTYVIHTPSARVRVIRPILAQSHRTLAAAMAVIESSPPMFLPRRHAYTPSGGWSRNRAFWTAGRGDSATRIPNACLESPLDCTADVKVHDQMRSRLPETVTIDYVALEAAVVRWADSRACALVNQLRAAIEQGGEGRCQYPAPRQAESHEPRGPVRLTRQHGLDRGKD